MTELLAERREVGKKQPHSRERSGAVLPKGRYCGSERHAENSASIAVISEARELAWETRKCRPREVKSRTRRLLRLRSPKQLKSKRWTEKRRTHKVACTDVMQGCPYHAATVSETGDLSVCHWGCQLRRLVRVVSWPPTPARVAAQAGVVPNARSSGKRLPVGTDSPLPDLRQGGGALNCRKRAPCDWACWQSAAAERALPPHYPHTEAAPGTTKIQRTPEGECGTIQPLQPSSPPWS